MRANKSIETIMLQFYALCSGDAVLEGKAKSVENEFLLGQTVKDRVKGQEIMRLNKVLHYTRALDSGIRTFLEMNGDLPTNKYSLGAYISQLHKVKPAGFGYLRLPQQAMQRAQSTIVDKRNLYMHVAGSYPTVHETDVLVNDIKDFFQQVISLKI